MSPSVTATAECLGLRPVAKAFGCSDGITVQPRHRQAGPLREILDVGVDLGCGGPLERLSAAHLQRDPVREPVHREVEADRDQEEQDESSRTADEGAE